MNLLLLGKNLVGDKKYSNYRGTHRCWPSYVEHLDQKHEVNQLITWYLDEGGESGIISDLQKARGLVARYRDVRPSENMEIVEVVAQGGIAQADGKLLGFDLSCRFGYSLLCWGLDFDLERSGLGSIGPLLRLCGAYFRPRLNRNGLFQERTDADFCLECLLALQRLHPGLFESDEDSVFEVIEVYSVET